MSRPPFQFESGLPPNRKLALSEHMNRIEVFRSVKQHVHTDECYRSGLGLRQSCLRPPLPMPRNSPLRPATDAERLQAGRRSMRSHSVGEPSKTQRRACRHEIMLNSTDAKRRQPGRKTGPRKQKPSIGAERRQPGRKTGPQEKKFGIDAESRQPGCKTGLHERKPGIEAERRQPVRKTGPHKQKPGLLVYDDEDKENSGASANPCANPYANPTANPSARRSARLRNRASYPMPTARPTAMPTARPATPETTSNEPDQSGPMEKADNTDCPLSDSSSSSSSEEGLSSDSDDPNDEKQIMYFRDEDDDTSDADVIYMVEARHTCLKTWLWFTTTSRCTVDANGRDLVTVWRILGPEDSRRMCDIYMRWRLYKLTREDVQQWLDADRFNRGRGLVPLEP